MKEFYLVVPEGWEGKHYTLEEAQKLAIEYLKSGYRSYLVKAVSLCKRKEPAVDWIDFDEEE